MYLHLHILISSFQINPSNLRVPQAHGVLTPSCYREDAVRCSNIWLMDVQIHERVCVHVGSLRRGSRLRPPDDIPSCQRNHCSRRRSCVRTNSASDFFLLLMLSCKVPAWTRTDTSFPPMSRQPRSPRKRGSNNTVSIYLRPIRFSLDAL